MGVTKYIFLHILSNILYTSSLPLLNRPPRDSILLDYTNYNSFHPQGDGTYSFGYEIEDPESNNIQFRDEERQSNGTVVGSYGWVKPDGNIIMVRYVADHNGYRAEVENSEGQIKFYGQQTPNINDQSTKSPAMINALNSKKNYAQPSLHEQHSRPVDSFSVNKNQVQSNNIFRNKYLTITNTDDSNEQL